MKKTLRDRARSERKLFRNSERQLFRWLHILDTQEVKLADTVATYISYGDEPDTSVINQNLLLANKKLVIPRVRKDYGLDWVYWSGGSESLQENRNLLEPIGPELSQDELSKITVVITPALLVDHNGVRLGQGGGCYDRALLTLRNLSMQLWSVALVYDGEIVNFDLPCEEHDQLVNAVATPEILLRLKN